MFAGTFHWIDDFSNYIGFAQQAEDGRILFENKLVLGDHDGTLVNVEWWLVGLISRVCGRRPFLAYRLLGLLVLAGLLFTVDRVLRRGGLPLRARFPALLLVSFGGGLGGVLFDFTERPVWRCADLSLGFFPFFEALANPHWLLGTWLLLESILAYSEARTWRGVLKATLIATCLGLSRPYDLVLSVLVHAAAVLLSTRPAAWPRALLPLAGLVPVVSYLYWVFFVSPHFGTYATTDYFHPPPGDLLLALGPALVLALLGQRAGAGASAPALRIRLWLWAGIAVGIAISSPVTFSLQFVVGAGLPLLMLGCWTLGGVRRGAFVIVALAFSTTSLVATRIVLQSDPHWHVPAERRQAALALRSSCEPGDLALTPDDVGLFVLSLTSCKPLVSHPWAPQNAYRQALVRGFYASMSSSERTALLDQLGIRHVLLPGEPGPVPASWLGAGTPFRQVGRVGTATRAISLYTRARPERD